MRSFLILVVMTAGFFATAEAQGTRPVPVSSWVTELIAGGGVDIALRGPWMDREWRSNAARRVLFGTSVSLIYEYIIEPWNGQVNGAKWQDAGQRLVGTLGIEVLGMLLRLPFK